MASGFFPAQVDSVAAICRRLAYHFFTTDNAEQFNAVAFGKLSSPEDNFSQAEYGRSKSALPRGDGLGERLISRYCKAMPKGVDCG